MSTSSERTNHIDISCPISLHKGTGCLRRASQQLADMLHDGVVSCLNVSRQMGLRKRLNNSTQSFKGRREVMALSNVLSGNGAFLPGAELLNLGLKLHTLLSGFLERPLRQLDLLVEPRQFDIPLAFEGALLPVKLSLDVTELQVQRLGGLPLALALEQFEASSLALKELLCFRNVRKPFDINLERRNLGFNVVLGRLLVVLQVTFRGAGTGCRAQHSHLSLELLDTSALLVTSCVCG